MLLKVVRVSVIRRVGRYRLLGKLPCIVSQKYCPTYAKQLINFDHREDDNNVSALYHTDSAACLLTKCSWTVYATI